MRKVAILALTMATQASGLEFQVTTDLGADFSYLDYPPVAQLPPAFQGSADAVLNGQFQVDWNVQAYLTDDLELGLRYGLQARSELATTNANNTQTGAADYRFADLPADLQVDYGQTLDRLNLRWYSPFGDFVVGRQAISFGQARVFSPIDVVQPADVTRLDNSYRAGVDAIRATWLLGAVSELEGGAVLGEDKLYFARLKAFLLSTDWELIGLQINEDQRIVSLGTTAAVGQIGVWQETAWLDSDDSQGLRATIGADTTLFDDLYLFSELHYNELGQAENYLAGLTQSFYQLGAVQPWAQWYLSVQGNYPVNVLTQLALGSTVNLNDGSALVNGSLSYNASQLMTVSMNAAVPVSESVGLDQEYSLYPAAFTVSLDWTF